jgi:DNA adenine methylase
MAADPPIAEGAMTPTRPIVRYHGGKWRLAPWIISYFPAHRVYVEPFGGGGSVLLRKPRSYAEVYNDIDCEIANLFRVARDQGEALRRAVEMTPFSRDEFTESFNTIGDPIERARRVLVRSFMGFGSASSTQATKCQNPKTGFRANSNRSGTTPAHDWASYPLALEKVIRRLQGVVIENRDASAVILAHDSPGTLHYVDPPYLPETRDDGRDYRHEMSEQDHIDLAKLLGTVEGAVIVSGYPSELYDDLYHGWIRAERAAYADGALPRVEVLWMRGIDLGLFAEAEA